MTGAASATYYREDGRLPDQLRKTILKSGVLRQANGSASVEMGNTKVIACVEGPSDSHMKSRNYSDSRLEVFCNISWAPFSRREHRDSAKVTSSDKRNTERCLMLENIFRSMILSENYNNSKINIQIEIFQSDGCELAACINAASYALVDAGIMAKEIVTACSSTSILPPVASAQNKSAVLPVAIVDPNGSELGRNPTLTMAMLGNKVVFHEIDNGKVHPLTLNNLTTLCIDGCCSLRLLIRSQLQVDSTKAAALQYI